MSGRRAKLPYAFGYVWKLSVTNSQWKVQSLRKWPVCRVYVQGNIGHSLALSLSFSRIWNTKEMKTFDQCTAIESCLWADDLPNIVEVMTCSTFYNEEELLVSSTVGERNQNTHPSHISLDCSFWLFLSRWSNKVVCLSDVLTWTWMSEQMRLIEVAFLQQTSSCRLFEQEDKVVTSVISMPVFASLS